MRSRLQLATATAAFVAASIVAAAAQTPPPTSQTSTPSRTSSSDNVTVTGCLQEGSSASSSTAPADRSASAMPAFILANATMGSSAGTTSTATTTGTTGTVASSAAGKSYSLDGKDSDLKKHVGHRIEVTGTMDPSAASNPAGATSTTTSTTPAGKIKVSSIKMISADCSAK